MIYIQTPRQKELYMRYGELLHLDGTYRVNKINFPLYTLLIEDNFGIGQAVGHAFLRNETVNDILEFLACFSRVHQFNNSLSNDLLKYDVFAE